jgi:protein arginine kinase
MLHLPGLRLANEVEQVVKGLDKMGLAVRGLLGEGTEAFGNMFQISNQTTLGETEERIIGQIVRVVEEVARHEGNARARLMEDRRAYVLDQIGRSYGVLTHARLLSSREAVDMLSALRVGVEFGLVNDLTVSSINGIMLLTQPGHLQKMEKRSLGPEERDAVRARIVRERLKHVTIQE